MLKRIKAYFAKKKQRKKLQKYINHEILEVLASICLYLDTDGRRTHNIGARPMHNHFCTLKEFSDELRKEIIEQEDKERKNDV